MTVDYKCPNCGLEIYMPDPKFLLNRWKEHLTVANLCGCGECIRYIKKQIKELENGKSK
jgi:hypothetical protein